MVLEVIKKRQGVRSYLDKEIPENVLQQVLEAGRLAPSASNKQYWKFIVVKDEDLRKRMVPACKNQKFVGEAPVVIVGCATNPEHIMPCGEHSYPVDLAIALDHMSLQAAALGLGTCWIGAFYQDEVKEIMGIPKGVRVVALMPLGFPKELGSKIERKPLSEIVCYDKYIL
ncbi:nitroreductase family protein [bacterium]|nr:nitroreductase family protein [bacterium]